MSYNGSGTFLINTAGQPVVSGTVISSTAFNALTADLATGLSTAITKDGQTTVTANIPMSTYKFTGLGAGSAATDSVNLSQVQSTVSKLLNTITGTNTITATASPTLSAYATGQMFYFVAAGDNTTSVTLNIDGLGAKAVTRDGSTALISGDIKSGEVVVVVYDGTRFQVVSQVNSAGDATFANVSITSALNVGGVSTFTGLITANGGVSGALNGTVGATTPNTGAFTTLTTSSTVTLNGGTANGVAYLNGSKVLTSGSAVTYDGTTFALGAAWTSNPFGQTVAPGYFQYSASNQTLRIAGDAQSNFQAFRFSNDSGAPAMTLGKARGTYASPSAVQTGDNLGDLQFRGYGGTNSRTLANVLGFVETYTSDSNISSYLEFRTSSSGSASGTEKMRLTAAGNLGINTTTPGYFLEIVNNSTASSIGLTRSSATARTWTMGIDGDGGYRLTDAGSGVVTLSALPSGITYLASQTELAFRYNSTTEGMRLTSTGLGIGTTSPARRLDIRNSGNPVYANVGNYGADNAGALFLLSGSSTTKNWFIGNQYNVSGALEFTQSTATGGTTISATPSMVLDSSGNLGIGTTSPGQKLEVAGNQRFTGSQVGTKIENRQTAVSVTGATTILDDAGSLGRLVVVNGESGANRFCDLVLASTGASPTVVASFTAIGTPAARTYTRSGSALQLAMASGTYTVSALALGY